MGKASSYKGDRPQAERDALRLLCSDLISPETRAQLAGLLNERSFHDELNRIVYQETVAVGAVSARRLRELLPGRVTLRGFPDFDLKDFLAYSSAQEDIDKLFDSLLDLTDESDDENRNALGQSA
jgi:hypothetical protein